MPKIFISHSSKDNVFAKRLADSLRERGADVWIDLSDIAAGMKWSTAIQRGLDEGEVLILVVTPDSMASNNVEDEWQYYLDNGKVVIPVNWIPAKRHFQVSRLQYVDFHGQDFGAALVKLIAELARRGFALPQIQTPPPAPPRIQGGEKDTREFPIIIKPDWVGKIIPEPFEWCVVPAGKVTLEKGGYLTEQTMFEVVEFQIARYPVTNAQFEVFVTANDGWRDAAWWDYSDAGKAWRAREGQSEVARFKNCADCPRETVTWYAAVAFARWLSAKTGANITLPTEQQWQRVAQGDDARTYPWGNEWDASKCNSKESGIGNTMPVTQYPQGASPYGVLDMNGNVWQWCLTDWDTGSNNWTLTSARIMRGGSFDSSWDRTVCTVRDHYRSPDFKSRYAGFRVIRDL